MDRTFKHRRLNPVIWITLLLGNMELGVSTFTITLTRSPDKAVFGLNQFQLSCTYNVGANEEANSFKWQRKRVGERTYVDIARFFPPSSIFNGSIIDIDLNTRVSLTEPTSGNTNGVLTFSEIQCNDEAVYRCEGTYSTSTGSPTAEASIAVQVSKTAAFSAGTTIPFSPGSGLKEGDKVTFTCDEDIGKAPQGTLHWYYFIDGQTVGTDITSVASTPSSNFNQLTCSYKQTSTLVLTMEKRYNRFVVRCTLVQFKTGQAGDGVRQTDPIPVNYKPTITSITPDDTEYVRGQSVILTCSGEGNPAPSTQWVLSNGTVVQSSQLVLIDLSLTADHTYTCQLQNNYGGVIYTDSRSVVLSVVEATTRPTTIQPTTIQPTTTTTAESKTKQQTETCVECPLTVTAIVSTLCGIVIGVLSVLGTIYIKGRYTGGKTESNVVPNSQEPPSMTDIAMTVHTNVAPDGTHGRMDEACYQDLKRDRAASASEYQTLHLTGGKTESNVIPNSQEPPSMTDNAMPVYTNVVPEGTHGRMDEACYQDLKQDRAASVFEYQTLNLTDTGSK